MFDAYSVNAAEEKSLVKEVFTNAIDCLSEDDKKLPQVGTVWHALTVDAVAHVCCTSCSDVNCVGASASPVQLHMWITDKALQNQSKVMWIATCDSSVLHLQNCMHHSTPSPV